MFPRFWGCRVFFLWAVTHRGASESGEVGGEGLEGEDAQLTYVVIAILYQECDSIAIEVLLASSLLQPVPGLADIAQELSVLESPTRQRVYHGGGIWIVTCNCVEEG